MSLVSDTFSRKTMAKKRKVPKRTPDWLAERERTQAMVRERIAYHEAKAREQDEARARQRRD
jgi:hypothetical protein